MDLIDYHNEQVGKQLTLQVIKIHNTVILSHSCYNVININWRITFPKIDVFLF